MGIDIEACIMVGLPRGEFNSEQLIADDELVTCAARYDGDGDPEAIAGFMFMDTSYSQELEYDQAKIEELKTKFFLLTEKHAKVYLSPRVW